MWQTYLMLVVGVDGVAYFWQIEVRDDEPAKDTPLPESEPPQDVLRRLHSEENWRRSPRGQYDCPDSGPISEGIQKNINHMFAAMQQARQRGDGSTLKLRHYVCREYTNHMGV
jgi:hypothetical protein